MTLSYNSLLLLRSLVNQQQISMSASREEIEAVLAARDELEAAIAEAELAPNRDTSGTKGKPRHNGRVTEPAS